MITIVMATRNRAESLGRTLAALAAQRGAPDWHLVVADNGSRDGTPEVLHAAGRWLRLTCVAVSSPGMTAALNATLAHVAGELVVKCDDDLLPEPDWLAAYARVAACRPDVSVFGGVTEAEWPAPPPVWLWRDPRAMGVLYAVTPVKAGPCSPTAIWGPHWAVRRSALGTARFDETIGPGAGPRYVMGGETELFQRLACDGHAGFITDAARARHLIRPEQLEETWMLGRAHACGLGVARMGRARRSPLRRAAWRLAAHLARGLPRSALRTRVLFTDSLLGGMGAA